MFFSDLVEVVGWKLTSNSFQPGLPWTTLAILQGLPFRRGARKNSMEDHRGMTYMAAWEVQRLQPAVSWSVTDVLSSDTF